MFKEMREALGIPKSVDILDHIRSLSNEADGSDSDPPNGAAQTPSTPSSPRSRAVAAIQAIERRAMTSQRPQPGLQQLMAYLHRRDMRKALCTRNFPAPVDHLLSKFLRDPNEFGVFEPIITRDTMGIRPKPSPEGIWTIVASWGVKGDSFPEALQDSEGIDGEDVDVLKMAKRHLGSGIIMVGDSIDDMAAGYRAGAATVLLVNEENEHLLTHQFTGRGIRRLDQLIGILENGFEENA